MFPVIRISLSKDSEKHGAMLEAEVLPYNAKLDEKLRGLPQRYYRFSKWVFPQTEENITYLAALINEDPDSFELSEAARLAVKVSLMSARLADEKAVRRAKFVFGEDPPPLPKLPDGSEYPFVYSPYKHQQVAMHSCLHEEAFALLMEMGTGKTFICVNRAAFECIKKSGSVEAARQECTGPDVMYKVLIIAPKSLLGVWKREFEKFCPIPFVYRALMGNPEKKIDAMVELVKDPSRLKVLAVNYESVRKIEKILAAFNFDLCIADESSRIKNPSAKRTKAAISVARTTKQRMILTGTPVTNCVSDLFAQFEFIKTGALGFTSKKAFDDTFVVTDYYTRKKSVKNALLLKKRIGRYSFIVKKKDCLDLPNKIYERRDIVLGASQRTAYNQMRELFLTELLTDLEEDLVDEVVPSSQWGNRSYIDDGRSNVSAKIILTKYLRLMQITSGFAKTDDGREVEFKPNAKLEEAMSLIKELPEDQKVIVWSRFTHDLHALERELNEAGINCVRYDGTVSTEMSEVALNEFENNDLCRVFLGNQAKGGVGLTLLGSEFCPVTTVIYYANDFSLEKRLQSEDRCHRVGLRNPITYIDLVVPGSIDEYVLQALQSKKNLLEGFTNVREMAKVILGEELK